jgi:heterodisulfide reductase subunit A
VVQDDNEMPAAEIVEAVRARVEAHPQIEIHRSTRLESVEGYIGNYKVKLRSTNGNGNEPQTRDISTIIVATGMRELDPAGLYDHDSDSRVITQLQLEQRIQSSDLDGLQNVVIVNCVGSRNEERGCCNVGCLVSIKNALAVKAASPEARVHVLHRDLNLLRDERHHLEQAKAAGVRFLRFADDEYPRLNRKEEGLEIEVRDVLLGKTLTVPAELLVLTTGFQGCDSVEELKGQLKVSASKDGFFQEAHIKLGPLDFPSDGISLCGCAKGPKTLKESVEEGIGAAMRASIPMKRGYIEADGIVADVDLENCEQCGLCVSKCPYGAIVDNEDKEPFVIKALCKGCGLCAADCPMDCFTLVHYTDEQLQAQVEEALAEKPGEKILGFVCHWCALGGVDMAGVSRLQYPTNGRLIRVMCSARVSTKLVERAFELGAGGVLVAGCEFPTCHYITGNYECETRMKRARRKLAKQGYDTGKLWNLWCSAADGPKFAKAMTDMVEQLGLGRETKGE